MDIKKVEVGYPCFSYIVRKIKNESELWYFSKVAIQTYLKRDVTHAQAVNRLTAVLSMLDPESNVSIPDLSKLGDTPEDICERILLNSTVPESKGCLALYRKTDGRVNACKICPFSNKYTAENLAIEYALLKFMFKDEASCSLVKKNFDDTFFNACIDVSIGAIPTEKCYALPIPKILFDTVLKENVGSLLFTKLDSVFLGEDTSPFSITWESAFNYFPRAFKVPAVLVNNPIWGTSLKSIVKNEIDNARDLTEDDLLKLLRGSYEEPKDDYVQSNISEYVNLPVPKSKKVNSYNEKNKASLPIEGLDKLSDAEKETLQNEINNNDESTESNNETTAESGLENEAPVSTTSEASPTAETSYTADSTVKDEGMYVDLPTDTEVTDGQNTNTVSTQEEDSKNTSEVFDKYAKINDELYENSVRKNIIVSVNATKELLSEFMDISDNLPMAAYHGFLRDKKMPIEALSYFNDEGKEEFYLLMYSRHIDKYLVCKADSMPVLLQNLISRKKIKLICHTPYLLYCVSKMFNYPAKNVFSIVSAYEYVYKPKEIPFITELVDLFKIDKKLSYEKYKENNPLIYSMQLYNEIEEQLIKKIDAMSDFLGYHNRELFNMAVGYSFLYTQNFADNGRICIYRNDGVFVFPERYRNIPKKKTSRFISYSVGENIDATGLFLHICEQLALKGIFRTLDIQLMALHKQILTFYINQDVEDYVSTFIDMVIFKYTNEHFNQSVKVSSHRYF